MYVSHDVAGGSGLATVVRSAGDGAREDRACLGRVVDRARGACRSKQGQGPVLLRPGDGRVRARAGGRRGAATPAPQARRSPCRSATCSC